jgi:general secretion pathway protein G
VVAALVAPFFLLPGCRESEEYLRTVVGAQDRSAVAALKTSYRALATSLETYQIENGRYPARLEDLPEVASGRFPGKDPWDAAFRYRATGTSYEVRSLGPDGREDTEDDVVMRDGHVE